jgi:hypothetical protein
MDRPSSPSACADVKSACDEVSYAGRAEEPAHAAGGSSRPRVAKHLSAGWTPAGLGEFRGSPPSRRRPRAARSFAPRSRDAGPSARCLDPAKISARRPPLGARSRPRGPPDGTPVRGRIGHLAYAPAYSVARSRRRGPSAGAAPHVYNASGPRRCPATAATRALRRDARRWSRAPSTRSSSARARGGGGCARASGGGATRPRAPGPSRAMHRTRAGARL